MNPAIFKAYDIRGKVGTELTPEVCWNIGQAFADWLPDQGAVAVGRDMRPDSAELAKAVIEGLLLQGREVLDIGMVSGDMLYFAVGHHGLAGGAMITTAQNNGGYGGIKLCREEVKPIGIDTGLADIRDMVLAGNFTPAAQKGKLRSRDLKADWVSHVLGFVDVTSWPTYSVAIDAGNGMLGVVAPVLAEHIPLRITPMFYELDGTFPNHPANPLLPEGTAALRKKIVDEQLDFGIAFDGSGDRAVLVDERGEVLGGTVMTALLSRYFLAKNPGATILYNAICGRAVKETVIRNGGKAIRTKVGHSFIKADMRAHDAVFAGEHSSHYYFRDNWSADSGLLAAMVATQVLAESGKKLSELAAEYKTHVAISEKNFAVNDAQAVLERIQEVFNDGTQDTLDGVTINYESSWFNVRVSNTEPLLRLNAEASTQDELQALVARIKQVIQQN